MGSRGVIRISLREEYDLLEAVCALLAGGIGLLDAYTSARDVLRGRCRRATAGIAAALERGASPAQAVDAVLARVDPTHRTMLHVVDETGASYAALRRARALLEARLALRDRIVAAALYPALVVVGTLAGAVLLLTVVLPAAEELLLPLASAGEQGVGDVVERGFVVVRIVLSVVVAAVAGGGLVALSKRPQWRTPRLDRLRLGIPVVGNLELLTDLLAFAQTVAGMTAAGAPLTEALAAGARTAHNLAVRAALGGAARDVNTGASVAESLREALPAGRTPARWFALVERGADLETSLNALIVYLETRLEAISGRLGSVVEPVLILTAGAVLLTFVLTLVRPLFELFALVGI